MLRLAREEIDKELETHTKRVESLVDEGKELHPKYLVSALGIAPGENLKKLKQLTNRGLNDFLESRRSHRFNLGSDWSELIFALHWKCRGIL